MLTLLTSSGGRLKDSRRLGIVKSVSKILLPVGDRPLLLKLFLFFFSSGVMPESKHPTLFFIKIRSILGNSVADELKYHNYDL